MSEEEIAEVMKRVKDPPAQASIVVSSSPQTERRLKQTNSHFLVNAINIASLAVLTSVGVNFMLDTFKDKRDTVLREEIKERVSSGARET